MGKVGYEHLEKSEQIELINTQDDKHTAEAEEKALEALIKSMMDCDVPIEEALQCGYTQEQIDAVLQKINSENEAPRGKPMQEYTFEQYLSYVRWSIGPKICWSAQDIVKDLVNELSDELALEIASRFAARVTSGEFNESVDELAIELIVRKYIADGTPIKNILRLSYTTEKVNTVLRKLNIEPL